MQNSIESCVDTVTVNTEITLTHQQIIHKNIHCHVCNVLYYYIIVWSVQAIPTVLTQSTDSMSRLHNPKPMGNHPMQCLLLRNI